MLRALRMFDNLSENITLFHLHMCLISLTAYQISIKALILNF